MGLFDFLKTKQSTIQHPIGNVTQTQSNHLDYPIADFQWNYVKSEIERLNELLKTVDCTKKLHMNINVLTEDSYFRYEPFTPKTGKISKYPCMLHACANTYMGYSVSIWYDIKDNIGKGQMHIATRLLTYTIDFKTVNNGLIITKVVTTDDKLNNRKLYHVQKDGTVFTSK